MFRKIIGVVAAMLLVTVTIAKAYAMDKENTLYLETKNGRIVIEMYPDKAPNHIARIKQLAREGFYDGVVFHRVIDGFMVQGGDPTGTGGGGSKYPDLKAEFNDVKHVRGIMSMARTNYPHSANSQFFIMLGDAPYLDGQYTAWGRVVSGMEFVDKIKKGTGGNGIVNDPDSIVSMKVAADVDG